MYQPGHLLRGFGESAGDLERDRRRFDAVERAVLDALAQRQELIRAGLEGRHLHERSAVDHLDAHRGQDVGQAGEARPDARFSQKRMTARSVEKQPLLKRL